MRRLHVGGSASEYSVVSLPDFVYNVLLQRVSFAQYVTKWPLLKITTQKEMGWGG